MPCSLDMCVFADLFELRATPTLHICRVLLSIDPIVLAHVVRLGLLGQGIIRVMRIWIWLPLPTQHVHLV